MILLNLVVYPGRSYLSFKIESAISLLSVVNHLIMNRKISYYSDWELDVLEIQIKNLKLHVIVCPSVTPQRRDFRGGGPARVADRSPWRRRTTASHVDGTLYSVGSRSGKGSQSNTDSSWRQVRFSLCSLCPWLDFCWSLRLMVPKITQRTKQVVTQTLMIKNSHMRKDRSANTVTTAR